MATSIFPDVTVTQVRPLVAQNKPLPVLPVGYVGPRFKRITEDRANAYYINPETAPSVAVQMNMPGAGEYIDYDSVLVSLRSAATGETSILSPNDQEIVGVRTLIQDNISLKASGETYGFYAEKSSGGDWVFFPTKGSKQTYAALKGDYLVLPGQVHKKIKQVSPTLLSDLNFAVNSGTLDDGTTPTEAEFNIDLGGISSVSAFDNAWLVGVDKNDSDNILQFHITDTTFDDPDNLLTVDSGMAGLSDNLSALTHASTAVTVANYYWYVYDIPIGAILTYAVSGSPTLTGKYSVYSYNLRVDGDGALTTGNIGKVAANSTSSDYYFLPDSRGLSSYVGVNEGYYLKAVNRSNSDIKYNFRIKKVGSTIKKVLPLNQLVITESTYASSVLTLKTSHHHGLTSGDVVNIVGATYTGGSLSGSFTCAASTATDVIKIAHADLGTYTDNSGYVTSPILSGADYIFEGFSDLVSGVDYDLNKSFLVAINKSNPGISYNYEITGVASSAGIWTNITVHSSSWDGATKITGTALADYDWYISDTPYTSLKIEGGSDFINIQGSSANSYDFSIVDTADYYVSGKNEVTILNYLTDANGDPIGLADVLFDYRILETVDANQMFDITSSDLRDKYCGTTSPSSINPMGLVGLLADVNTTFSYKVISTDIALTERDPDAPKSFSGRYYPGETNSNYANVNNLDWGSAKDLVNNIKDTQIPYYFIPLSGAADVTAMFASAVDFFSAPDKMKEMITFITTSLPSRETVLANINVSSGDFEVDVNSHLRFRPSTKYVSSSQPAVSINFLQIGARKGDFVIYTDSETGEEKTVKITNIYPNYYDLGIVDNFVSSADTSKKITIGKIYQNKNQIAEALAKKGQAFNSFRVKLLWGDGCDVSLGSDVYTAMPMFYAAAAYAAMANGVGPVNPKTNRTIGGISKIYNVYPFFNDDQLQIIGAGNVDILTQDFDGGPVYSKRQFMTDGSELSGVEPVDKFSKSIRSSFRPYLGKNNITPALFDVLGTVLAGLIETYKPSHFSDLVLLEALRVSGPNRDRLTVKFRPTTYRPFNGLDATVEVD